MTFHSIRGRCFYFAWPSLTGQLVTISMFAFPGVTDILIAAMSTPRFTEPLHWDSVFVFVLVVSPQLCLLTALLHYFHFKYFYLSVIYLSVKINIFRFSILRNMYIHPLEVELPMQWYCEVCYSTVGQNQLNIGCVQ